MKLREMGENDLEFMLSIRNLDSTRVNLGTDEVFSIEEATNWFRSLTSPWYIIYSEDVKVGYFRTDGEIIGCDIHPDHRRKGLARRAYEKYLSDKTFAKLWVFEDNFAKKLYEDLGFVETGKTTIVRNRKYLEMSWNR